MKICNKEFRKIPSERENPIDDYIINFFEYFNDNIMRLKTDPNYISIFRLIMFTFFWNIYINNKTRKNAIILLFIFCLNYILDCLDGYLARKCDSVTVFGDLIDHIADISIAIMLVHSMRPLTYNDITILTLTVVLAMAHFGCQQKYYNNSAENMETLDLMIPLCIVDYKYLRYFSAATLALVFGVMFYFKNIREY